MNFRYKLPSLSALNAFESAARHCNFSRAADELATSQPAVSRHVTALEQSLGTALFERTGNRVALSDDGRRLYHAVVAGFEEIGRAVDELKRSPRRPVMTIACSYDVAHLWLMPRHEGLQEVLGPETEIRVVASEYEQQNLSPDKGIDLRLTYLDPLPDGIDSVELLGEEVSPVCAPAFAQQHAELLEALGCGALAELPLLHLTKRNFGWASWPVWFQAFGLEEGAAPPPRRFSSYVYLLEAASSGAGMALGWNGLADRYLEQGRLVRPLSEQLRPGGAFRAVANRHSANADVIDKVLAYLGSSLAVP